MVAIAIIVSVILFAGLVAAIPASLIVERAREQEDPGGE